MRVTGAVVVALALAVVTPRAGRAASTGPQAGATGVPAGNGFEAELTCVACHTTFPQNPDADGRLELRGVPERYAPGERYDLTIALSSVNPAVKRWGFELTAVALRTLRGAGQLLVSDPMTTQVIEGGAGDRQYVEHGYNGTAPGKTGGTSWTFAWIAPASDVGDVGFFAAANAANMDGSKEGDRVYTSSPAPLAVARGSGAEPAAPAEDDAPARRAPRRRGR